MKQESLLLKLRLLFFFTVFLCANNLVKGQSFPVTGTVTDSAGKGLENVSVKMSGGAGGTVTAGDGTFTLSVPSPGAVLIFSSIGYNSQQIKADKAGQALHVSLLHSNEALTDVVVVGYISQSKTKTTAAISKVNVEEFKNNRSSVQNYACSYERPSRSCFSDN